MNFQGSALWMEEPRPRGNRRLKPGAGGRNLLCLLNAELEHPCPHPCPHRQARSTYTPLTLAYASRHPAISGQRAWGAGSRGEAGRVTLLPSCALRSGLGDAKRKVLTFQTHIPARLTPPHAAQPGLARPKLSLVQVSSSQFSPNPTQQKSKFILTQPNQHSARPHQPAPPSRSSTCPGGGGGGFRNPTPPPKPSVGHPPILLPGLGAPPASLPTADLRARSGAAHSRPRRPRGHSPLLLPLPSPTPLLPSFLPSPFPSSPSTPPPTFPPLPPPLPLPTPPPPYSSSPSPSVLLLLPLPLPTPPPRPPPPSLLLLLLPLPTPPPPPPHSSSPSPSPPPPSWFSVILAFSTSAGFLVVSPSPSLP